MPDVGCAAAAAELRRHIPAIQACLESLENVLLVSRRVLFAPDPYGILWPEVRGIMLGLHHGQDELVMAVAHNLRLFEARFHVTAAAYEADDAEAADAAMLDGAGVRDVVEAKADKNLAEPIGWGAPEPGFELPEDAADWLRRLRSLRHAGVLLGGDSRAFAEHGAVWRDIAIGMRRTADIFAAAVDTELGSWRGAGAASYQSMIAANITIIRDTAAIADQMAECVQECTWLAVLTRKLYLLTLDACAAAFGEPDATGVPMRAWINGCVLTMVDISKSAEEVRRNAYSERED